MTTGNRITLAPDMARRCLHVRLQCNEEKPHLREGFRYPNLTDHVRRQRGELLSAALTILKAYAVAEKPAVDLAAWGSFEEWSQTVRGAIVWCGLPDPAQTRGELEEEAEEGVTEHALLLEGWHQLQLATGREDGMTVKEAVAFLKSDPPTAPLLREVLDGRGRGKGDLEPLVIARRLREATPDVLWDEAAILVRRSHTLGEEVMQKTKTGLRQRINLPPQVIEVLRWHVDTMLVTPDQQASDLLFPREDGLFRSESSLKKAFAEVGRLIGLKKKFSPRGMRRTFNDLARAAKVESLVTKSISGHLTDRMKDHYSTVSPGEQRESIGRVLDLVQGDGEPDGAPPSGAPGGAPTSVKWCSGGHRLQ